ncbi:hypothetical protein SAMN05421872_11424 [Nocardioides lianchengensis]|uniref:Uncharacterized protein n=1 Tax=Nocardioides lianchengensis TaxID=1045774 RepID=A0A1G6ZS87_9ACTN|nr:hypothetical protein SAMN05421872_11424 [Nocardioides lianchengensis]
MPICGPLVPGVAGSLRSSYPSADDGRVIRSSLLVVVASLALGALTSWAQGVLPDALASFANSPSGWTLLTVLLVAAARPSIAVGSVLGVASFVSLVLGYQLGSAVRGLTYDPTLWGVVGVIAGPFVGAAAAAIVGRRVLPAVLGAGALAGVLVSDGIYGLTVVADSTSPVYWTLCLVAGTVLVLVVAARLRSVAAGGLLLATAAAATGVLSLGYGVLNAGFSG